MRPLYLRKYSSILLDSALLAWDRRIRRQVNSTFDRSGHSKQRRAVKELSMKRSVSLLLVSAMFLLFARASMAQAWIQLAPNGALPNGRVGAYVVFAPASNKLIVFGG